MKKCDCNYYKKKIRQLEELVMEQALLIGALKAYMKLDEVEKNEDK